MTAPSYFNTDRTSSANRSACLGIASAMLSNIRVAAGDENGAPGGTSFAEATNRVNTSSRYGGSNRRSASAINATTACRNTSICAVVSTAKVWVCSFITDLAALISNHSCGLDVSEPARASA